jgi:hypothetical protein
MNVDMLKQAAFEHGARQRLIELQKEAGLGQLAGKAFQKLRSVGGKAINSVSNWLSKGNMPVTRSGADMMDPAVIAGASRRFKGGARPSKSTGPVARAEVAQSISSTGKASPQPPPLPETATSGSPLIAPTGLPSVGGADASAPGWASRIYRKLPEGARTWINDNQGLAGGAVGGATGLGLAQGGNMIANSYRRNRIENAGPMERMGLALQLALNPSSFTNRVGL